MTIRIRKCTPSDQEFILSLVTRFSEFNLPEWRTTTEINRTNYLALMQALDNPEDASTILIAEDENGVQAGFIHLQTQTDYFNGEKHGYISDLAVSQAFEGQGVGRMLLDTAESWTLEQGYRLLTLYVFADNTRAKGLYEKIGFQPEVVKYVKPLQ